MFSPFSETSRSTAIAMAGAAAVSAQFVSGKATRDALFLTSLDYTALPTMLIATGVCSILLVALNVRAARRFAPATLVPVSFAISGLFFLFEWLWRPVAPALTASVIYLHVSGAGPLLASGFWLISSERFDPRTAKLQFGRIAAAGTIGGLLSALLAERVGATLGAPTMLLFLAVLQFGSAWLSRRLASSDDNGASPAGLVVRETARSGLRVVAEAPHLRHLGYVVVLGATSAALMDYLFKASVAETFGPGDQLLRFFALYYAATSVLTFVAQVSSSRLLLERFGIALTMSTPSLAVLLGGLSNLIAPGFASIMLARGGEAVCRGSLFRTGYELFYTPIPADDKRSVKSIIDVAFDRVGDAGAGTLVRMALWLAPAAQSTTILVLALVGSAGAILAASRLNRGYVRTLERSLLDKARGVDFRAVGKTGTITMNFEALRQRHAGAAKADLADPDTQNPTLLDPEVRDIVRLRSRNRQQIMDVLARQEGLSAALVPHAIPLLAWDPVAEHALFALRKIAEEHVGELVDALIDPNQDFAVRRRLVRVFSVCVSQRAVDGLMFGLDDVRFDVRYQAARSLAEILDRNPLLRLDTARIYAVVLREVGVGRPVWESRRLLDGLRIGETPSPLDAFVRDRAGTSLAHVFTLLSLVLPREPVQIAFRSLHTDNRQLRGTALEYLEGILPEPIRERLWPFLERRPVTRQIRPRDEVIADLLRSHQSITLNLEDLQRQIVVDVARDPIPSGA